MMRRASHRLDHPPLEGEGRRERSERRGGVSLAHQASPHPGSQLRRSIADAPHRRSWIKNGGKAAYALPLQGRVKRSAWRAIHA
jgi:hypothetical protein